VLGAEPIPSLADVLGGFPGAQVNIDVKSHAAIGPTLDAIRHTASWSRVRLAAFSHTRLVALRGAAGPSVASALTPREVLALKLAERSPGGRTPRPPRGLPLRAGLAAQVPGDARLGLITGRFVAAAHRHGIEVHAWTVNRPAEMNRLLELGVDAIITDRADLLRELLIGRGQWQG
jgi:glycerophosphoryl diester phosphodiesterase